MTVLERPTPEPPAAAHPDPWRSLVAVVLAALAAGFSIGLSTPLIALALEQRGWSATVNGANAAMPAIAIVLLGRHIPAVAARFGAIRAMVGGILVSAAFLALFPVLDSIVLWFVLRFGQGLGIALAWIVSETWINRIATERTRGRMVAVYAMLWSGGIALGPQLLRLTGTEGATPFVLSALILAAGAVPLLLARRLAPSLDGQETVGAAHLGQLWRLAPIALLASFVGGFAEVGSFSLFPLWAVNVGLGSGGAVAMLSVFSIGGLLMQFPIGWLADRFDRERLLVACGAVAFAGPALLPFVLGQPLVMWPLLFMAGCGVMGFYTLGLTVLGQRFPPEQLAAGNVIFVAAYMIGGIAGPVAGGAALDVWMPHGFPMMLAALFLGFVLFGLATVRRG